MMGRPVSNKHRVPKKQWRRWTEAGRRVFNNTFVHLEAQQDWAHPSAVLMPKAHWRTVRWNAAWLAAEHATDATA